MALYALQGTKYEKFGRKHQRQAKWVGRKLKMQQTKICSDFNKCESQKVENM